MSARAPASSPKRLALAMRCCAQRCTATTCSRSASGQRRLSTAASCRQLGHAGKPLSGLAGRIKRASSLCRSLQCSSSACSQKLLSLSSGEKAWLARALLRAQRSRRS